jgi:hypothetical protein
VLTTVAELRARLRGDMSGLIRDLQDRTGRYGEDEARFLAALRTLRVPRAD